MSVAALQTGWGAHPIAVYLNILERDKISVWLNARNEGISIKRKANNKNEEICK